MVFRFGRCRDELPLLPIHIAPFQEEDLGGASQAAIAAEGEDEPPLIRRTARALPLDFVRRLIQRLVSRPARHFARFHSNTFLNRGSADESIGSAPARVASAWKSAAAVLSMARK